MCSTNNTYFKFSSRCSNSRPVGAGRFLSIHPFATHPPNPSIHSPPTKTLPIIPPIMVFVQYDSQLKALVVRWLLARRTATEINNDLDFNIHWKTMSRWLSLYIRTRNVVRDASTYEDRGRPLAINAEEREFMLDVLEHQPTLYLDEIQVHIEAMTGVRHPLTTIYDDLRHRLQLTRKVAATVHPARSAIQRANYICHIAQIPSEFLVFIDEAGVSQDTHRRTHAWACKGRRTSRIPRRHDARRINVLPAVSLDGLICSIAQPGSMTRLDLKYFLEEVLIPCMNPYPGRNSVLVMDNHQIHHRGRIQEICFLRSEESPQEGPDPQWKLG
ncbi:hypothetical protein PGT21_050235 [Puccinia graminis f. sp. tritici]|uniref:Tc1-like transposase DDE domain-containing protein n=1 Tax=Puccinia graminis f. sp. tritici TaxID=56615 RepID=A0A5B0MDD1_PUCGR|nr:hypothetical protein PGTUg99_050017 [Puccinia graminis f. sp. tritici]KAA1090718.1 hypothetical protein PGT21_050235 [Puccinia graminis f. sp. tritici]